MRFLPLAVLLIGMTTFAQSKVGVIDVDFVLNQLPEMEQVRTKMKDYVDQLDADFSKKLGEYNELRDTYEAKKDGLSQEDLQKEQQVLIDKEMDIQKFQQNAAQLMEIQQQEYLRPLYQKIGVALTKVAESGNFTMVQELSSDVVYLDPEYNLTISILDELGIEISEEEIQE